MFPRKRWTEGIKSARGLWRTFGEARRFVSDLRKRRFDVGIDFHGILKSGLLCFLSGSRKRIGFDRKSTKEGNFLFSNEKVLLPKEKMSRFKRNLALLEGLGLEVKSLDFKIYIPAKDREDVGCNPCRNRSCEELHCLKLNTVGKAFNGAKDILRLSD